MTMRAGIYDNMAGSMADAIEKAFEEQWKIYKDEELPEFGTVDRHLLFAAISRGILRYLKIHSSSIRVSVEPEFDGLNFEGHVTSIDVADV